MYNEEFKNRFLSSNFTSDQQNHIVAYTSLFERTGYYEENVARKDLYEFTKTDFIGLFSREGWGHKGTFAVNKTKIRKYIIFAITVKKVYPEQLSVIKSLRHSDIKSDNSIDTEMFKDLDDLFAVLDKALSINNNVGQYRNQIIALCLAWMRVPYEKTIFIKQNDVDFERGCIILNQDEYSMSQPIADKIKSVIDIIEYDHPEYRRVYTYRTDFLLKPTYTKVDMLSYQALKSRITQLNELLISLPLTDPFRNRKFLYGKIEDSSLFCEMMEIGVDFDLPVRQNAMIMHEHYPEKSIEAFITIIVNYESWYKFFME